VEILHYSELVMEGVQVLQYMNKFSINEKLSS
jgi:hypothetical protein